MNKIKLYFIKRKISKMMRDFQWEQNTPVTREKIKTRLSKILKVDYFVDKTTPELVDNNGLSFTGPSKNKKKVLHITLNFLNSEMTYENIRTRE